MNLNRVINHAVILMKYSILEGLSRPRELFTGSIGGLLFSAIFIIPGILMRGSVTMAFSAGVIAAWFNLAALQSFHTMISDGIRDGEFESFLMVPVSPFSLYLVGVMRTIVGAPFFFIMIIYVFLETGRVAFNPAFFLAALVFTFFVNCGLSIIFGAIQMAYRLIGQLVNVISILIFSLCQLVVVAGFLPEPFGILIRLIPWSQSTVLFGYAFDELTGSQFDPLYAIAYLLFFGLLTIAAAIPIFGRAEHRARTKGLMERVSAPLP